MDSDKFTFEVLPNSYAVCQLRPEQPVPLRALQGEFFSITKTDGELSLVCETDRVPEGVTAELGWRILRIAAVLDFAMVGVLAVISGTLAREAIAIFAISTYNTDYLLVKEKDLKAAVSALRQAGHQVNESKLEKG